MGGIVAFGLAALGAFVFLMFRFSKEGRKNPQSAGDDFERGAAWFFTFIFGSFALSCGGITIFEWFAHEFDLINSENEASFARGVGGVIGLYAGWRLAAWVSPPTET